MTKSLFRGIIIGMNSDREPLMRPERNKNMKKTILRKYAKLIAANGGNVQKGQDVMIYASVEQPEFAKMVAEECYRLGARYVRIEWEYQPMTKLSMKAC